MTPAQVLLGTIVALLIIGAPVIALMIYCCCWKDVCRLKPKPLRPYKKLDEEKKEAESAPIFEAEPLPPEEQTDPAQTEQ